MKKLIAISLAFLLLLAQFGVHTKSHFCMDRLTHFELIPSSNISSESLCPCGIDYEKAGCCHDLEVHSSIRTEGISQVTLTLQKTFPSIFFVFLPVLFRFEPTQSSKCYRLDFYEKLHPPKWLSCWEVIRLLI